jgi:hypothetical protein
LELLLCKEAREENEQNKQMKRRVGTLELGRKENVESKTNPSGETERIEA